MTTSADDPAIVEAVTAHRAASEAVAATSRVIEPHGRCYRALELSALEDAEAALFAAIDAYAAKALDNPAFDIARWGGLPAQPDTAAHRMVARFREEFDRLHSEARAAREDARKARRDDNRKANALRKLAARIAKLEST